MTPGRRTRTLAPLPRFCLLERGKMDSHRLTWLLWKREDMERNLQSAGANLDAPLQCELISLAGCPAGGANQPTMLQNDSAVNKSSARCPIVCFNVSTAAEANASRPQAPPPRLLNLRRIPFPHQHVSQVAVCWNVSFLKPERIRADFKKKTKMLR